MTVENKIEHGINNTRGGRREEKRGDGDAVPTSLFYMIGQKFWHIKNTYVEKRLNVDQEERRWQKRCTKEKIEYV